MAVEDFVSRAVDFEITKTGVRVFVPMVALYGFDYNRKFPCPHCKETVTLDSVQKNTAMDEIHHILHDKCPSCKKEVSRFIGPRSMISIQTNWKDIDKKQMNIITENKKQLKLFNKEWAKASLKDRVKLEGIFRHNVLRGEFIDEAESRFLGCEAKRRALRIANEREADYLARARPVAVSRIYKKGSAHHI